MIDSQYYEAQCYIRGTSPAAAYHYSGFGGKGWHGYPEYDSKIEEIKHVLNVGMEATIYCTKNDVNKVAVEQKKKISTYKSFYSVLISKPTSYDRSIGLSLGISGDLGISLAFDRNGDMALLWAFNAGFSSDFVGVSYSASTTTINGNTVDDFMGGSWVEGGAVSIPVYGPLSVGVTGDRIESYDGKIVGKSVGKTMGISAGCFGNTIKLRKRDEQNVNFAEKYLTKQ